MSSLPTPWVRPGEQKRLGETRAAADSEREPKSDEDEGDRAPEAAGRPLELVRQEHEERAARGQLAEVGEILGRHHAAAESGPVGRLVVLHQADPAGVDAYVPDAALVEEDDRVLAGRRVRAVVAEAVGERPVVAVRPARAKQDDLTRFERAVLVLPDAQQLRRDDRALAQVRGLTGRRGVDQVADVD